MPRTFLSGKRSASRIAIEENNNKKRNDSVLPVEFVEEFENRFLKTRDAETRKSRRKTSHAR